MLLSWFELRLFSPQGRFPSEEVRNTSCICEILSSPSGLYPEILAHRLSVDWLSLPGNRVKLSETAAILLCRPKHCGLTIKMCFYPVD